MVKQQKYEPNQYKEIHPYMPEGAHKPKSAVSIPADGVNVLPKERARSAPPMTNRHEPFQFGTNPMEMTDFEKTLVAKEKGERNAARDKYIAGIQGRDGGEFAHQQYPDVWPDKF